MSNYLTEKKQWVALQNHFNEIKSKHLDDFFKNDSKRAEKFTISDGSVYLDFSKNRMNDTTLNLLVDLAENCNLVSEIEAMFTGKKINRTENRAVLHTALR